MLLFKKRYLTIVLGRFVNRRRLHVIHGYINDRVIRLRSGIKQPRDSALDLMRSGFYSPM